MAIEDEIINISDIDIGTEILNSDKLLIETSNGTKMIAFKDFVVGPDNISSVRQNQIEGNVEGEADTFYNVVTGFNILNNQTTPGLNTQYDQISGTVELGKFNFNAIANLASVSADIAMNSAALDELRVVIAQLQSVLNDTSSSVLNSVTLTTSACNAAVQGAFIGSTGLSFTTKELDPATTNPNCTIALEPFSMTFPEANQGFVDGSRFHIFGKFSGKIRVFAAGGGNVKGTGGISIHKKKVDGSVVPLWNTSKTYRGTAGTYHDFDVNTIVRINLGDQLFVTASNLRGIKSGNLDIFKIA